VNAATTRVVVDAGAARWAPRSRRRCAQRPAGAGPARAGRRSRAAGNAIARRGRGSPRSRWAARCLEAVR